MLFCILTTDEYNEIDSNICSSAGHVFSITTLDDDDSAGISLSGLINKSYNGKSVVVFARFSLCRYKKTQLFC
jgi:hypothetical protein